MRVIAGRYELGRPIGAGGMATVYEAVDGQLGRRVAVKVFEAAGADPASRDRFVGEARAAATISHPNVVTVFDAGEDGTTLYIAMELIEGPSLAAALAERGPLDVEEAMAIADQMLAGIGAAHRRGLVHRDVKPGNVLLTIEGTAKLADFGIAKSLDALTASLTRTGQVVGTARYLAPEQAAGGLTSPATDVYAAGVVLYEMLAGEPPFTHDTPLAIALAHQREPVPPLAHRRPGLPAGLVAVVARALAKEPADRFDGAEAMRAALRSADQAGLTATIPNGAATTAVLPRTATIPSRTTSTAVLPGAAADRSGRRRPAGFVVAGALLALAVAAVALALAAGGDDEGPEVVATTSTTTTTTEPSTTTTSPPLTPGSLTDLLVNGPPSAYGEKGPDLLALLQKVQREKPGKRSNEARAGIEEIRKWMAEGKLDRELGAAAIAVLEPIAAEPVSEEDDD